MNVMFHTTSSLVDRGISSAPDREPAAVVRAGDDVRVGVDVVERRDSVEDVVAVVELDERVRRLGTEHIDLWINQPVSRVRLAEKRRDNLIYALTSTQRGRPIEPMITAAKGACGSIVGLKGVR